MAFCVGCDDYPLSRGDTSFVPQRPLLGYINKSSLAGESLVCGSHSTALPRVSGSPSNTSAHHQAVRYLVLTILHLFS